MNNIIVRTKSNAQNKWKSKQWKNDAETKKPSIYFIHIRLINSSTSSRYMLGYMNENENKNSNCTQYILTDEIKILLTTGNQINNNNWELYFDVINYNTNTISLLILLLLLLLLVLQSLLSFFIHSWIRLNRSILHPPARPTNSVTNKKYRR